MKARIIRDTKQLDFPFSIIPEGSIVEIIGNKTEEDTIVIRASKKINTIIKFEDLKILEEEE